MKPRSHFALSLVALASLSACAAGGTSSSAAVRAATVTVGVATSASLDASAVASDAATDARDAAPSPQALSIFGAPLAEGVGLIIGASRGATVTLTPEQSGVAPIDLRDGERVRYLDDDAQMGVDRGTARIEARGVEGRVPNGAVITEERLHRSPDGRWAVFSTIESCGDYCHAGLALLSATERRDLCEHELCAGPEIVVAWSADGQRLAVGSHQLTIVSLATQAIRRIEQRSSPAFSRDGRLFVRGITEDDGVFEVTDAAERRVYSARGRARVSTVDVPIGPPTPVVFEQDGAVLCAAFVRRTDVRYARATLEGRSVAGSRPCAR
jgi:hypothetical protein